MSAKVAGYRVHPAAEMFPMMGAEGLAELAKDIAANGLLEEVVLLEDAILDGRNRAAACELAGVEVATREWSGDEDPWEWVVSKNLHRRHLTESQRAMVGAALVKHFTAAAAARAKTGTLPPIGGRVGTAASQAAKVSGSTERSVERASAVLKSSPPEIVNAVQSGEVSVADAAKVAGSPKGKQKSALAEVKSGKSPTLAAALLKQGTLPPIGGRVSDENGEEITDPDVAAAYVLLRERVKVVAQHLQNGKNAWGRIDKEVESAGMKRIAFASAYRSLRDSIEKKLDQLIFAIKSDAPFALCTFCKGVAPADGEEACKFCRGAGWTNEFGYTTSMEGVNRAQAKAVRR